MTTVPQGNMGKPRACSRDPTEAIQTRLGGMLNVFLQHLKYNEGNEETKELAEKCCREAVIWYYRILENLVSHERNRLGIGGISGILENDLFQRCLVACCLEITVTSKHPPYGFPVLLQIFKLAPYHFWKVIEPVLRDGVSLPHSLFSHFAQVEQRVLESMAWSSDSPLWEEIRANEGHLPTCQQVMPPAQLENPIKTDSEPGLSAATDQQPSAVNTPERSSSLQLFARKVYMLMGKRLRELCSMLDISDELRLKIWTCFEHSLVHCIHLIVDRHLDQLLMCAIYIIARITKVDIPFKHIMKCYKSQPHTSNSVCKNMLISGRVMENPLSETNNNGDQSSAIPTPDTPSAHYPGPSQEERGNLIIFYNQVYSTKMKHFAKQFVPTSGGDTPPLSPYPRLWKASPRAYRLSSSHSIFISPFNTETSPPRTPGLCYYFNSSPSERLREINNMIKTGGSPSRRRYVMSLDTEDEGEEGEDGPSAKRLRLDDQSAWQRRLRSVVNDRVTNRSQDQTCTVAKPNLH
ncbi:retinoblastoma-like protein 2 isoform X2 [Amphiprion ocellaris]|uniref:retinoblastoma-like protein 2 isoform X2 n=1 Tax=Amphiprion ocellaris TaxID=80972 RepID=UPI002410D512|nr:retinoblastoma-like protein 2 isoform X2 [Amphiprion ocellaris]